MHKITQVLEFPPREERSIFVKGEFLYAICTSLIKKINKY